MTFFLSLLPATWPWLILITAQVTALLGRTAIALSLLVLFASIAAATGLMTPVAVAAVVCGLAGAALLPHLKGGAALAGHTLLILWCLVMGAHLLPGFQNLKVLDQVQAGAGSVGFTMHLNLDKPMVFFAVLLAWPRMLHRAIQSKTGPLVAGLLLLPGLFLLGLALGAVQPEFSIPPWWLIFVLSNLFLTCLTEEAFFRGYLQSAIASRLGAVGGVVTASLLFGLAHFGGGPPLVIFASILGLACGLGYYATQRLWVPVAIHFGFNLVHLLFYTYPGPA
ncbi:CPBP family intramembrane glutamic endopeptidase [Ruegeria sp. 6PALISEP08]|uniref:CPBP family intramembrane glutamic endopeptidase n=1 Tax=Ruegeria sp. 6PALISEP08 TaxID=1225660 RepID=UPI00067E767F|nr:CPBP family intramembrane glutamic endopeptidase [Ruegeria sp. 6PALISEP08]